MFSDGKSVCSTQSRFKTKVYGVKRLKEDGRAGSPVLSVGNREDGKLYKATLLYGVIRQPKGMITSSPLSLAKASRPMSP